MPLRALVEQLLATRVRLVLTCLAERPAVARLYLMEAPSAGAGGRAARDEAVDHFVTLLDGELTALGVPPRTPRLTGMAVGGIHDVVQSRVMSGELCELPELATELSAHWASAFAR